MKTTATLLLLFIPALSLSWPGAGPTVMSGKVDTVVAKANRLTVQSGLRNAGTVKLPAGEVWFDQALEIGPECSGSTLEGAGPQTVIRNQFYTGNGPNGSLWVYGRGVSYMANSTPAPDGAALILDPNVAGTGLPWDHPSAQTELLKPGATVYGFVYDSYVTQAVPPRARYVIKSFDPATRRLEFTVRPDPTMLALKWLDGSPAGVVKEGGKTVLLVDTNTAAAFLPGSYAYVTSGPSLANGAVGEHRRVVSCDSVSGMVTLDKPVTRDYTLTSLARLRPAAGVTVRHLTVGQPLNQQAFCQLDFICDVTFDHVVFHTPQDPGQPSLGMNSCGRVTFKGCTVGGGGLALNACHDVAVSGGTVASVMGEEGTTNCKLDGTVVRLDPRKSGQAFNGVGWTVGSDRLSITNTRIEGFGGLIQGQGGARQCPMIYSGRGLVMQDVVIANTEAGTGSYISSDGGSVTRLSADGAMYLTSGLKWKLQDSATAGWDLRAGTTGAAVGCLPPPPPATGWKITP